MTESNSLLLSTYENSKGFSVWYMFSMLKINPHEISIRLLILLFGLISFCGCKSSEKEPLPLTEKVVLKASSMVEEKSPSIDSAKLNINFKAKGNYKSFKSEILEDKNYFKISYANNREKTIDTASKYLYTKLINDIVPHWYNTPWDFNGHTNIPNEGEIACGYFVSTTLKHLGFNVNRYKMAQQAGLNEAIALQPKEELKIYRNLDFDVLRRKVNEVYNNGVYFVGLDNHVGYILIHDKVLYFLHSSYYDNKVLIELAETSPCFKSNIYVFAEITSNKNLIKKWVLNEALHIPQS